MTDTRERLIQFKTNMDVVMSVLDRNGLGDWLADRLVEIGDSVKDQFQLRIDVKRDPFLDERLRVANLPEEPQTLTVKNPVSGAEKQLKVALFRKDFQVKQSDTARDRHAKAMAAKTDCIDCHFGIAHTEPDGPGPKELKIAR